MARKHKRKQKKSQAYYLENPTSSWWLLPLFFIVAFVPLIVYAKLFTLSEAEAFYWRGGQLHIDFFSYYKSVFFSIFAFISFLIVLILKWMDKISLHHKPIWILCGIYGLFTIFSALNAPIGIVAMRGFMETFQGIFVLLGYMMVVLSTMHLVQNKTHLKVLLTAFIIVGVATFVVGAFQFFDRDPLQTESGLRWVMPAHLYQYIDDFSFRFGAHRIYATMYNTNFVGSFAAMLIPLSIGLFFAVRRFYLIPLAALFVIMMVFVGIGSNSRAGYIAIIFGLLMMAIFYRGIIIKKPGRLVFIVLGFVLIGVPANTYSEGRILEQIKRLQLWQEWALVSEDDIYFEDLAFDENTLTILTNKESLVISWDGWQFSYRSLEGEILNYNQNTHIHFEDERFENYRITPDGPTKLNVWMYGETINIRATTDGLVMLRRDGSEGVPTQPPRLKCLDGYETLFSSRGYIWSRSMPLLLDTFLIGQGPDSFVMRFPNDDDIGRLNGIRDALIDKPHNLYIQIGVNTGVISLLALIGIFAMYLFQSVKLFIKNRFDAFEEIIGVALFIGVSSYLITGFINDQIISVAPVFYVLIGLGFASNRLIHLKNSMKHEN